MTLGSMHEPAVDVHLYIFGVLWCCCRSTAHAGLQMSCHMQYQGGHPAGGANRHTESTRDTGSGLLGVSLRMGFM